MRRVTESRNRRPFWGALGLVAASIILLTLNVAVPSFSQNSIGTIQGKVVDPTGKPVRDLPVRLKAVVGGATLPASKTDAAGLFVFSGVSPGSYNLSAAGRDAAANSPVALAAGETKEVDLVLAPSGAAIHEAAPTQAMQFTDAPNFTVAGVTDWTAVGGHGSDATLRTSEALARETLTLRPDGSAKEASASGDHELESRLRAAVAEAPISFVANRQLGEFYCHAGRYREALPLLEAAYRTNPGDYENEYALALAYQGAGDLAKAREHTRRLLTREDKAELHRLAGEIDEQMADPLAAVHEYERAAALDPSETNYFAWGSELLLHRAVWQAQQVFHKGIEAYPGSARMQTALGSALFAGDLYDEAAARLCEASDLSPEDAQPYLFLGRIAMAAPEPLVCVEPKLARFAQQNPENAFANYFYAMAIRKRLGPSPGQQALEPVEILLRRAVKDEPTFSDAYLQLGILEALRHNLEGAIGYYTKAIEANPQLGEAHYRLGVAYDRTGEAGKAKAEFARHDEIEKRQAEVIERQRRDVKQFLVVMQGVAAPTSDEDRAKKQIH